MKKRQLQRSQKTKKKKGSDQGIVIKTKAAQTAKAAASKQASIDCIGNFIFFSTPSGEGWMLDHRKNYALRLADKGEILDYQIRESAERFQIEWKERYRIENDLFIASCRGEETVFEGYPVDAIDGMIQLIKKKEKGARSPSGPFRK